MLFLASQSPRRCELLKQIGVAFNVHAVDIDETPVSNEQPESYIERLSMAKARACLQQTQATFTLGSDTSVILGNKILGKPRDEADCVDMLLALSQRQHHVLTGVALLSNNTEDFLLSDTVVRFGEINRQQALSYWQSGEPADKAGSYGIQGLGAIFVEQISGSYSGVMGLPLFETYQLLKKRDLVAL